MIGRSGTPTDCEIVFWRIGICVWLFQDYLYCDAHSNDVDN